MFIIRVLLGIIASAWFLCLFVPIWRAIEQMPELYSPPYDFRLVKAARFAVGVSISNIALSSIMLSFTSAEDAMIPISIFFGVVDTPFAWLLITSINWQVKLLGTALHSCKEANNPYEDGTPSFFTMVGNHVGRSPEKVCQDMASALVAEGFETAVSFICSKGFLFSLCVVAIVPFSLTIFAVLKSTWIALQVIYQVTVEIIVGVTDGVKRRFRFTVRYLGKLKRRRATFDLEDPAVLDLGDGANQDDVEMARLITETIPLAGVDGLETQDDKEPVSSCYLHFADVISKRDPALANTIGQSNDFDLDQLRIDTCTNGSKADCWACENQICDGCKFYRDVPDPEITEHLNCMTICSKCYFRYCCGKSGRSSLNPELTCAHRSSSESNVLFREVCSVCAAKRTRELRLSRQVREARELKGLETAIGRSVFCKTCESSIPEGKPRWWACNVCATWCKNDAMHSQWVPKSR